MCRGILRGFIMVWRWFLLKKKVCFSDGFVENWPKEIDQKYEMKIHMVFDFFFYDHCPNFSLQV